MDAAIIGAVGVVGGAAVTALGAWIVARVTAKPQVIASDAQVQAAINEGFRALAGQYEARNADLLAQNAVLEGKLDEALHKLDQTQGELRDLVQHVESLESALRRLGHDIPERRKTAHPLAKPPLTIIPKPDKPHG